MLAYNEVRERAYIVFEGEPYEVLSSHVFRKQQRKPVNQVKLRNLISGRQTEATFHQSDKVEEATIDTKEIQYLYTNRGESWFAEADDASARFSLPEEQVADSVKFIRPNDTITALVYDEKIVGTKVPLKVELTVKEAPPNIRGNTSTGGTKPVVMETGYIVNVPLFINVGDVLRINTQTGEYTERVEKA
jgi:elongation factor P